MFKIKITTENQLLSKILFSLCFLFLVFIQCGKKEAQLSESEIKQRIVNWVKEAHKDAKIEEFSDTVKISIFKGSTAVGVWLFPGTDMFGNREIFVDIFSFVALNVPFSHELASYLLKLNTHFGLFGCSFRYVPSERSGFGDISCKAFSFGSALSKNWLRTLIGIVGIMADTYDDTIVQKFGGKRVLDKAIERFKEKVSGE